MIETYAILKKRSKQAGKSKSKVKKIAKSVDGFKAMERLAKSALKRASKASIKPATTKQIMAEANSLAKRRQAAKDRDAVNRAPVGGPGNTKFDSGWMNP